MSYNRRLAVLFAKWSRKVVNGTLRHAGLKLTRVEKIVDLRGITGDPLEGAYQVGRDSFLLDVPLAHCRIVPCAAFPCALECGNPFVETLVRYARGEVLNYEQSPLEELYRSWQPENAAEALGVDGTDVSPFLTKSPALGFTMPWSYRDPAKSLRWWQAVIEADNREHGARAAAALGWKAWGPVDPSIGALEFRRLVNIYNSLQSKGYCRSSKPNGDIEGVVLSRNGEHRFMVTTGHHRSAALTALRKENVTIRLHGSSIVRRTEVKAWPNVRTGLFSPKQALTVFDRMFDGRQPSKFYQRCERLSSDWEDATVARTLSSSS